MDTKGVAAVERALAILNVFESANTPLTLSEISRRTGLYKSTVLRLMVSLTEAGYINQSEAGRYHLGPTLLRLGMMYQQTNDLLGRVQPVLDRLVESGSDSPSFFIRQNETTRLCVLRADSRYSTVDRVRPGVVLPISRGAAGKVFQAFDGSESGNPEIDRVRQQRIAFSTGETDPDCAAVAAPVFDSQRRLAGVLSISGPRSRYEGDLLREQAEFVIVGADELIRAFGGPMDLSPRLTTPAP